MTDEANDVIDAEYSDSQQTPNLPAAQNHAAAMPILGGDPTARMQTAQALVQHMASQCTGPNYVANIQGKNYPRVEWWTTVGATLELFPQEESCHRTDRPDGSYAYEAMVGVYSTSGQRITRAGAICASTEALGKNGEYAVRSMAVTRATAKAYRLGLSFLAVMAKIEATPAEEMPQNPPQQAPPQQQQPPQQQPSQAPPQQQQAPPQQQQPQSNNGTNTHHVAAVVQIKTGQSQKGPWTLWGIDTQQGTRFKTFDDNVAQQAQQAQQQGQSVTIKWSYEQRNGYDNYNVQELTIGAQQGGQGGAAQQQPQQQQPDAPQPPQGQMQVNATVSQVRQEQRRMGNEVIPVWLVDTNEQGTFGTKHQSIGQQAQQYAGSGQLVAINYTMSNTNAKVIASIGPANDPL